MDDYLIGIRLALDNGVSEGLNTIRADLAVLDRAVANSAEGLRALTTMAPFPQPARKTQSQPVGRISEAPSAISAPSPPSSSEPAPRAAPIIRITPPSQSAAPPVGWVSEAQPATSATPSSTTTPSPTVAPAIAISPTAPLSLAIKPSAPAVIPTAPRQLAAASLVAQRLPPSAPSLSDAPNAPPPPQSAPNQSTSFAPPPPAQSSHSSGGPVYLDGEYVGHWLSNHLAREANRPSAGGTSFDPNLGIAWPGAVQGGQ